MSGELTTSLSVLLHNSNYLVNVSRANDWVGYRAVCLLVFAPEGEKLLLQVIKCYVNPIISVVGFGANMMSVAILRRGGFRKPSNILLLGLVIADSMTLLQTMNFAEVLEYFGPGMHYPDLCGWQYGTTVNSLLLVSMILMTFFSTWGMCVSTIIPIVVTGERFFAVYTPLTFKKIVTPVSAFFSVVSAFIFWLPWAVSQILIYDVRDLLTKVLFLAIRRDDTLRGDTDTFNFFNFYVFDIATSWFPLTFVTVGCLLIGVKVKITLVRRRKLTTRKDKLKWSARTTRTLLSTCTIFSVTDCVSSLMSYTVSQVNVEYYIVSEFMSMVIMVNACSNFFVYVVSDKKMWLIFKDIVHWNVKRSG